jgi:hypothetical protein
MTFQEAVTKLEELMNGDMVSFESNGELNGFDLYEFIVTKNDMSKIMIHIGDNTVVEKGPT